MERPEITKLEDDFIFTSAERERIAAEVGEPLQFHTMPFEKTTRTNTFKTLPNGDANPNYGKEEPVLIFKAELDEGDAKGQWYSAWVSTSISERSQLGKISTALFGTFDGIKGKTAAELVNLPFRCSLKEYKTKTGETRQALDLDKIIKPAKGQTVGSTTDIVLTDLPEGDPAAQMLEALKDLD